MNEEEMNRLAGGQLSPEEARALAQRALDDPDLFDELTAVSVSRTGLSPRRRRKILWPWVAIAAAAAVVLLAVVWPVSRQPVGHTTMTMAAVASEPVLLARSHDSNSPVFRGADSGTESRGPRSMGSVVSVEDGLAAIDLGSVDGLAKGGQVEVIRNGTPAGSISVTTIFRERARGNVPSGVSLHAGDRVRVPDVEFLGALLDQIDASSVRGDTAGARRIAEQAARLTGDAAATDYADLNNLAAIAELRGDKVKAELLYDKALSAGPPDTARKSIEANLARVKGAK